MLFLKIGTRFAIKRCKVKNSILMISDINRIRIYSVLLIAIFVFSAIKTINKNKQNTQKDTSKVSTIKNQNNDLLKEYQYYSNLSEDITVKFFDQNDNLVYEGEIKSGEKINDKKLLLLLLDSDFLNDSNITTRYKIFRN